MMIYINRKKSEFFTDMNDRERWWGALSWGGGGGRTKALNSYLIRALLVGRLYS